MSLRLPSEIVVEDVLPTLRVLLARELADYGLTQQAIAAHLGVTQAAVSTYVSGDPALEARIADHPRTTATVESVAAGLASGEMDGYDALSAVLDLVRAFEDRGPICKSPRGQAPRLSRGLPFYASVEAGGTYSPLTFSVPRFKRTSTGAPPSPAFCRRRRCCKPMFLEAL